MRGLGEIRVIVASPAFFALRRVHGAAIDMARTLGEGRFARVSRRAEFVELTSNWQSTVSSEEKKKAPEPFSGCGGRSAIHSLSRRPAPGGNDAEEDYDNENEENVRARKHACGRYTGARETGIHQTGIHQTRRSARRTHACTDRPRGPASPAIRGAGVSGGIQEPHHEGHVMRRVATRQAVYCRNASQGCARAHFARSPRVAECQRSPVIY